MIINLSSTQLHIFGTTSQLQSKKRKVSDFKPNIFEESSWVQSLINYLVDFFLSAKLLKCILCFIHIMFYYFYYYPHFKSAKKLNKNVKQYLISLDPLLTLRPSWTRWTSATIWTLSKIHYNIRVLRQNIEMPFWNTELRFKLDVSYHVWAIFRINAIGLPIALKILANNNRIKRNVLYLTPSPLTVPM